MRFLLLKRRIQFKKIKIPKDKDNRLSIFLVPFWTSKDEGSACVMPFKLRNTWCSFKWLSSVSRAEINPLDSRAAINVLLFSSPKWNSLLGHHHFLPLVGIGSQDHRLRHLVLGGNDINSCRVWMTWSKKWDVHRWKITLENGPWCWEASNKHKIQEVFNGIPNEIGFEVASVRWWIFIAFINATSLRIISLFMCSPLNLQFAKHKNWGFSNNDNAALLVSDAGFWAEEWKVLGGNLKFQNFLRIFRYEAAEVQISFLWLGFGLQRWIFERVVLPYVLLCFTSCFVLKPIKHCLTVLSSNFSLPFHCLIQEFKSISAESSFLSILNTVKKPGKNIYDLLQ